MAREVMAIPQFPCWFLDYKCMLQVCLTYQVQRGILYTRCSHS
uniref:Uncharacterized protein n=1 Tax=Anguilla anguilla TaxID=7936 RepID=A0A0E9RK56_ANGAN